MEAVVSRRLRHRPFPIALGGWLLLAGCGGAPATTPQPPAIDPAPGHPATPAGEAPAPPTPLVPGVLRTALPNGMGVLLFPAEDSVGSHAEIVFGYLGGIDAGKPGCADLAAELLLDLGDSAAGRAPLRNRIEALGGGARVELGPGSTWFTLRVPHARAAEAIAALHAAVTAPSAARAQVERLRERLVQRRTRELTEAPLLAAADRMLLGDLGPADHLAALQDRDPSEVILFLLRQCRPDQSVLAIRARGDLVALGRGIAASLGAWRPASAPPTTSAPPQARMLRPGLHWATAAGPGCNAVLVLQLPPPTARLYLPQILLLQCLTLDGLGGRLERTLAEQGLGALRLRSGHLLRVERSALVLELAATPDQVLAVWQAVQRARRSLRDVPPSSSELALAAQSARLAVYREDTAGLRVALARQLRSEPDDLRLRQLARPPEPGDADLRAAAEALQDLPMAMLVSGPRPAAAPVELRELELVQPTATDELAAVAAARSQAATTELDRAVQALGGRLRLQRLQGYTARATLRATGGVPITEQLSWHSSGRLSRTAEVLQSVVETRIEPGSWVERVGDEERALEPRAAEFRLREAARHPLMLLAGWARGRQQFRFVATRTVQDREVAVLEAQGGRFERLRLHIDRQSNLVRAVESWETDPDGTPRYLVEHWSDYRTAAGLRVPFRRETDQDDGQNRVETVWQSFVPTFDG